jgi:uncharacterized protein (DUF927 family)
VNEFVEVNHVALNNIHKVLGHYLPGGKWQGNEYLALNPRRPDKTLGSFSINVNTGEWADFATEDAGGDIISLIAYVENVTQTAAKQSLSQLLGINNSSVAESKNVTQHSKARNSLSSTDTKPLHINQTNNVTTVTKPTWTALTPVPKRAPPPPTKHPSLGLISIKHIYRASDGQIICYICRFEIMSDDGLEKTFRPLTYCRSNTGQESWQWIGMPEPQILYNLDKITQYTEKTILFCEGEKCANAAAALLPSYITTTTQNGAKAPHKTDFTPLKGKRICIWRDNDVTGQKYAEEIARLAKEAGAISIQIINIEKFAFKPEIASSGEAIINTKRELPDGWDAADALQEGYTTAHIVAAMQEPDIFIDYLQMENDSKAATSESYAKLQNSPKAHYTTDKTAGVVYHGINDKGQFLPPKKICSNLEITALTRDEDSYNWGRLLEFEDRDKVPHKYALPMELLSGDGNEYRKELLRGGLEIERGSGINNLLDNYINQASPERKVICTSRIGWHNGETFVLPNMSIGSMSDQIIFQSTMSIPHNFKQKGTLDDWQTSIAKYCIGNSRLIFAVAAGFAPALMQFIGENSAGFNFTGQSSSGKTTALKVTASIFGDPEYVKRWRATSNGLEGIAHMHNHMLLILDELAQVAPEEAGEIAYMLANEQGKVRAQKSGLTRAPLGWKLLFLSAGEISLGEHMLTANKKVKAGQEVRLIDIPADAGAKLGLFENLHGFNSGAEFSRALVQSAQNYYGTALIVWLEKLTEFVKVPDNINRLKILQKQFINAALPKDANGQVIRVASIMALIACAGELATEFGITGWPAGNAIAAVTKCFNDWLEQRGGAGNLENSQILSQIRAIFETYGETHFTPWDSNDAHLSYERLGFKKHNSSTDNTTYYVFTETYKQRFCKGFNQRTVTKLLLEKRWLIPGSDGAASQSIRLPGIGTTRCYVFSTESWED